jgi:hypothetical protein
MPAEVILHVIQGKVPGQEFRFREPTTVLLGRGADCQIQLPSDSDHRVVSRHHCLLDINPPDVRIRDFGSRNGTRVNGRKIGRQQATPAMETLALAEQGLADGDEITLGKTVLGVRVRVPVVCGVCLAELPSGPTPPMDTAEGPSACPRCGASLPAGAQTETAVATPRAAHVCARCGRELAPEAGAGRDGDLVCAICQADPLGLVQGMLREANVGGQAPGPLSGCELLRELGRGGMGAVYLVRHRTSGEEMALKVMLPQVAANQAARTQFLREAENTRSLRHPQVVRLRDAGCSAGTFFFTLEYCEGGSVLRWLKERGGTLSVDEAAPLVLQVLAGLDYCHNADIPFVTRADGAVGPGRGLVHRDLKPGNIFLTGSGSSRVAKIGDYGLAKAFDAAGLSGHTRTGHLAGTPFFMPRQQVVNFKYVKPEADVWAAAATFYYLLTGQPPRDFSGRRDWYCVVLETRPMPIRERRPELPPRLAELIDHALTDQPAIPFKTAAEFEQALRSVL